LFGPRGVGKTTWIKQELPDALYLDLLEFNLYRDLLATPSRLETIIPKLFKGWIIIDEIQRVPELLNEVHRLIENYHYRFLLTGSSARSLRRKGINLLAGRALHFHMYPFVAQELGKDFNLVKSIEYGLLPSAVTMELPQKYLETYVQTYLREEVLQEGLTRNISAFSRFLEIASFSQGSIVNHSEIAREIGIDRQVVNNYFSILEDLLLSYQIPPFTKRAKRRTILHSKFYFFDVGIFRTLRPMGPLDIRSEAEGAVLETLFLQSAKAINDYLDLKYQIYFWRTATGQEVDFILYGPKGFHAFEIKRTAQITDKSLKSLKMFKTDYPEAKLHLIYMGNRREYQGNITILPMEEALIELPKLLSNLQHHNQF
jgi:predicted AAA+ superfamily ATPase